MLFGHDDAVTCVAASADLDLVASGGADGAILLHSLRRGRLVRTVSAAAEAAGAEAEAAAGRSQRGVPEMVRLLEARTSTARVLGVLRRYSAPRDVRDQPRVRRGADRAGGRVRRVLALAVTSDFRFAVTGGGEGRATVRFAHDLAVAARPRRPGPPVTALVVADGDVIVGGLADGRLAVWASPT